MTVEQGVQAVDQFPVGMRVLAVDDDQTCLLILETLLHRCQYHGPLLSLLLFSVILLRNDALDFDLAFGFGYSLQAPYLLSDFVSCQTPSNRFLIYMFLKHESIRFN